MMSKLGNVGNHLYSTIVWNQVLHRDFYYIHLEENFGRTFEKRAT